MLVSYLLNISAHTLRKFLQISQGDLRTGVRTVWQSDSPPSDTYKKIFEKLNLKFNLRILMSTILNINVDVKNVDINN